MRRKGNLGDHLTYQHHNTNPAERNTMTTFTKKQDSLVRELTMTMLTFDGSPEEIYDHLKGVFADPALTQEDRDLMPEIILQAFGTGTYILQTLRNREGFEAVDAYLQLAAAQWALTAEQDGPGAPTP